MFNALISICLMLLLFCHYNPIRSESLVAIRILGGVVVTAVEGF